jgi:antitoxin component YwqK of YwqJK toxin-antitoxin module
MKRILSLVGVVLVVGSFYWFRGPPSDGPYEIYHDNGQLWVKETYKDGELDGPTEVYYENGQLLSKGTYKDGEGDGPLEIYWDNGQLMSTGIYTNGEKCGEWVEEGETVTYDPC